MSKIKAPLNWLEKNCKQIFDSIPVLSYAWKKIENDFILIKHNKTAQDYGLNGIEIHEGLKASELYAEIPEIFSDLLICASQKKEFAKEVKLKQKATSQQGIYHCYYNFISPDIVLLHVNTEIPNYQFNSEKQAKKSGIIKFKKEDNSLLHNVNKFEKLLNEAPDIIFNVDCEGKILFINRVPEGYDIKKVIGSNCLNYLHPKYRDKGKRKLQEVFNKGESDVYEALALGGQGELFWVSIRLGAIKDDDDIVVSVLLILRDISEKKQAEDKLRESEEIFRTLTEQSFLGIIIIQDNLIKYVNKKAAKMFGLNIDEIMNWPPGELLKVIHPDDKKFVVEQLNKKQSGESDATTQYQFRGIKNSGEIIFLEVFSKTINYEGKPADFVTLLDITERIYFEKIIKDSELALRKRVKELSCLYDLSRIIDQQNESINEFMGHLVSLLPTAFQFPEKTCVRINLGHKEYKSIDFKQTDWKINSREKINGDIMEIEAYYKEDNQFMEEEIALLREISSRVKIFIEKRRTEEKLRSEKKFTEDLINTTSDTIFVFDPEKGKAIRWNKAFK
ncbi:MAG: PAS domain S-box protein, partial [Promethearchaeota archaeon]